MVEASDEIFSRGKIDSGFAADRGVDLREECRRDLHVANAAHIDGGEEAGDVAEDSATEGEEQPIAVGSGAGELFGERFDAGEALMTFTARKEENSWRFLVSLRKAGEEGLRPES